MEAELGAVFGGTADSRGYWRQNTRAVTAGGSGDVVHVSCAGWTKLAIRTPSDVLRSTGLCLKLDSISMEKGKG